ncbi:MT-A70 domain containing protein [Rhypophila decipiens]
MKKPSSSILYQNESKSAVLLDLPRSIEEAQFLPGNDVGRTTTGLRHIISSPPPPSPFQTPESKNASSSWGNETQSAGLNPSAQIAELMTLTAVEDALEVVRSSYDGPWYLPRHTESAPGKNTDLGQDGKGEDRGWTQPHHDRAPTNRTINELDLSNYLIPEDSHPILGSIESQRQAFLTAAPQFDLIIMDPPWPNRSAKRKRGSYQPLSDFGSTKALLSLIPVASHLAPGGLVAVWVTNSPKAAELLTARGGLFDDWHVDLAGEWTWLKVTATGESIVDIHATWKKPWERLLIAKKRSGIANSPSSSSESITRKVIVTVPDVHSRKPNLRGLFDELLPNGYKALEVFARNLTAGWWCWGDQVLLYQHKDHWVEVENEAVGSKLSPLTTGKDSALPRPETSDSQERS